MDAAVYLFTGFMDSGKTTLIDQTLLEGDFSDGKGLIIVCEEGEKEFDVNAYKKIGVEIVYIESEEEFTLETLQMYDFRYRPEQVFIEYNGTWEVAKILEMKLPTGWELVQHLATVDATTFQLYLTNMRSMIMEQMFGADLVLLNRVDESMPLSSFRGTIKAYNRKAVIVYERSDGTIIENVNEQLPYDIQQEKLEISDADFGIFFMDSQEHPERYDGKVIEFLGYIYRPKDQFKNQPEFVGGRFAMTCCEDDTQFIGYRCKGYLAAPGISHKSWQLITARAKKEYIKEYDADGIVLYPIEVKELSLIHI